MVSKVDKFILCTKAFSSVRASQHSIASTPSDQLLTPTDHAPRYCSTLDMQHVKASEPLNRIYALP